VVIATSHRPVSNIYPPRLGGDFFFPDSREYACLPLWIWTPFSLQTSDPLPFFSDEVPLTETTSGSFIDSLFSLVRRNLISSLPLLVLLLTQLRYVFLFSHSDAPLSEPSFLSHKGSVLVAAVAAFFFWHRPDTFLSLSPLPPGAILIGIRRLWLAETTPDLATPGDAASPRATSRNRPLSLTAARTRRSTSGK